MTGTVDGRRRALTPGAIEARRMLGQLGQVAERLHFTATRIGSPGCAVRLAAADDEAAVRWAIERLQPPAEPGPSAEGEA